jgi:hypothetical protein
MTIKWKWENQIRLLEPKGHRIFRDARDDFQAPELRGWAIADNSGGWPHATDDGVLWLDLSRPISVHLGDYTGASLPVRKERDPNHIGYTVMVGVNALLTIRQTFPHWKVEVSKDVATLVFALNLSPAVPV